VSLVAPSVLLSAALLVACVLALFDASVRLASAAAPRGLERLVGAAVIAGAMLALHALLLGLVGLGGSAPALGLAALATLLAARALLPRPEVPPGGELAAWWRELEVPARVGSAAAAGAWLLYIAWLIRWPSLGLDGVVYHLTESVVWAQQGRPGSIELATYEFPVGNYPVLSEVMVGWSNAVARSLPQAVVWAPAMLGLALLSGWLGLRELRVPRPAAAAALAAVALTPIAIDGLRGPSTDIAALGWLVSAAALAVVARRRPALLAPALLAAAMAVGVKTTALPYAAAIVAWGLLAARGEIRRLAVPLGAAAAAGAVLGGFWYARNLVDHGSPFWPFVAAPWGDPVPEYLARFDSSFLQSPVGTLEGRVGEYLSFVGGVPLLLAGALGAAIAARSRATGVAALVTVAGGIAWAASPYTGRSSLSRLFDLSLSTTRYLLPVVAAGALTVALAARRGRREEVIATVFLTACAAWSLGAAIALGFPRSPPGWLFVAGPAAGAATAAVVGLFPRLRLPSPTALAAGAVAATLGLALPAPGFLSRYADTGGFGSPVARWLDSRDDFRDGSRPVAFAPAPVSVLAGPRLRHRLEVIPARESCTRVRARARRGYVVLRRFEFERQLTRFTADECLAGLRPAFDHGGEWRVYTLAPG